MKSKSKSVIDKSIRDYLPKKQQITLVQARVATSVVGPVKEYMDKNDMGWSELITACLKKFMDEVNP